VTDSTVEALKAAVAALEDARVPEDLREVAFSRVLDNYLANEAGPSSASVPSGGTGAEGGGGGETADPSGKLQALAGKLDVGTDAVERVYDIDEDGVHLNIPRSKLDRKKKLAQQEAARLVAAARQATGDEQWTPVEVIGEAADDLGVKDTNFSKNISALNGVGLRIRGSAGKRELKMNQVGYEATAEIVRRLSEPQS
jgi:hypothetical protein